VGFELDGILKGVLYNKDGTVEYVFDDAKLNQVIAPLTNDNSERDKEQLFLSSSKDYEVSFNTEINEDILYQIGVIHWFDWWYRDEVKCEVKL
jgi:hypothetical protein